MSTTQDKISYNDYVEAKGKLDIRFGQIVACERVPKSYGLKLTVIFGADKSDEKTAFTSLGKQFEPEALIGITLPFIMNLEPSEIKGVKSEVMIMVGEKEDGTVELENFSIGTILK